MYLLLLFKYFIFTICLYSVSSIDINNNLINKKVDRLIDLTTQLVRVTTKLIVENPSDKIIGEYSFSVEPEYAEHLAYLSAFYTINGRRHPLIVHKKDNGHYLIKLNSNYEIKPKSQSGLIMIEQVFTNLLQPYPEQIKQGSRQLVKYNGNHYYYSFYSTRTQQTKVKLPASGSIESFSKLKPTAQVDRLISYGPYENIKELSKSSLQIHNENNSPFLIVTNLDRKIELSPWTNKVRVEDTIDIYHNGAKLMGPFSRYDYQKDQFSGINAVKVLKTKLRLDSTDIYYRDEIGNVSTSVVRVKEGQLQVELKPRFPLFGGWKTFYKLGYTLPLNEVVQTDPDNDQKKILKVSFVDHIYDNQVIKQAKVKIFFPEGATNFKLNSPFDVTSHQVETSYTYLDIKGRKVLTLTKNNLVNEHVQYLKISFDYNKLWMLQEPIILSLAFIFIIIFFYIYTKFDFSLTKRELETVKEKSS